MRKLSFFFLIEWMRTILWQENIVFLLFKGNCQKTSKTDVEIISRYKIPSSDVILLFLINTVSVPKTTFIHRKRINEYSYSPLSLHLL